MWAHLCAILVDASVQLQKAVVLKEGCLVERREELKKAQEQLLKYEV